MTVAIRGQTKDERQKGDGNRNRIQDITNVDVSQENGNHKRSLHKRSPIHLSDPNFLWEKPLFKATSKFFKGKGLKKLFLNPPPAPLKRLKGLKLLTKALKFKALLPLTKFPPI